MPAARTHFFENEENFKYLLKQTTKKNRLRRRTFKKYIVGMEIYIFSGISGTEVSDFFSTDLAEMSDFLTDCTEYQSFESTKLRNC